MEWGLCPALLHPACILEDGTSLLRTITKALGANGATGNGSSSLVQGGSKMKTRLFLVLLGLFPFCPLSPAQGIGSICRNGYRSFKRCRGLSQNYGHSSRHRRYTRDYFA